MPAWRARIAACEVAPPRAITNAVTRERSSEESWREVVPHRDDVMLEAALAFESAVIVIGLSPCP